MFKVLIIILFFILSSQVFSEEKYACVKYQRKDHSWGDSYKLPADIVSGEAVIEATNDYSFHSYSNYIVVTWPNGGYSLFEFPSYRDDLPYSYTKTKDQNERPYKIKEAPSYGDCR